MGGGNRCPGGPFSIWGIQADSRWRSLCPAPADCACPVNFVLEFLPEASAELECVTGNYEAHLGGLGARFQTEVESVCSAIIQHPLLWRLRPTGYRRVNLPGFPYYIAFVIEAPQVFIVAVAHSSRRPGYFNPRIP